jgi:hypothetical protein
VRASKAARYRSTLSFTFRSLVSASLSRSAAHCPASAPVSLDVAALAACNARSRKVGSMTAWWSDRNTASSNRRAGMAGASHSFRPRRRRPRHT